MYFEHIAVTTKNKDIQINKLHFIYAESGKTIKNVTIRIEKDAYLKGEALKNTIKIIDGMLM